MVFHGGHKETAQSAPAYRWCLRAYRPACEGTLCCHFLQFSTFCCFSLDWRDNLCRAIMRWCQRSARPPQTMDAVSRTVKSTPRGQATKVLAPSCAQGAQARGEGGVLSLIPNSQSTSAELLVLGRQDTICISAIYSSISQRSFTKLSFNNGDAH